MPVSSRFIYLIENKAIYTRFLILLGVLMSVLPGCSKAPEKVEATIRPVPLFQIMKREEESRTFVGRSHASREVDLSFRVAGELQSLAVKVGDSVKAGQMLARLDAKPYEIALHDVQAKRQQADADAQYHQKELRRGLDIREKQQGLISQQQLDQRHLNVKSAQAKQKSVLAQLDRANDNLVYSRLSSPFDGTVTAIYVENYETVGVGKPVVRVLDSSRIEMNIDVPEQLISLSGEVYDLQVVFDAFPHLQLPAAIKEITKEANSVTRTYRVTLEMEQPDNAPILPGMVGRVTGHRALLEAEEKGKKILPVNALAKDASGATFVWKVDPKTMQVHKTEVVSAGVVASGVLVQGELIVGDLIVTAGIYDLVEGQIVKAYQ